MKTAAKILLPAFLMIFLYSCTSSMSLTKRRYNTGFFVEHSSKVKQHKGESLITVEKGVLAVSEEKLSVAPETTKSSAEQEQITSGSEKRSVENFGHKKKAVSTSGQNIKSNSVDENKANTVEESDEVKNVSGNSAKKDIPVDGAGGSVNTILLVILAILLPPLAVYLKEGSPTKWFWVTFILCLLTFLGVYLSYIFSFWFIALIIALLVVLDVIK